MKYEKFLILKGCAGLGNRLFTICAAANYANKNNRILFVDWNDGQFAPKGENPFYEYFDLKDVNYVKSQEDISNLNTSSVYPKPWKFNLGKGIYESFSFHDNANFPVLLQKIMRRVNVRGALAKSFGYWQSKHFINEASINAFSPVFKTCCFPPGSYFKNGLKEDIIVFADFAPETTAAEFNKFISLKPHILAEVNSFVDQHNLKNNAIGVHIRATDKQPTAGLEVIFNKIKGLGLSNPKIFLATDNAKIAKAFNDKFPHTISLAYGLPEVSAGMGIHQIGFRSGNGELAAKVFHHSILDMWILSKCEYLFYQGNSTFSIISSFLHSDHNKVYDWQTMIKTDIASATIT